MPAPTSPKTLGIYPSLNITVDLEADLVLGDSIDFKQMSDSDSYKDATTKSVAGQQWDNLHLEIAFKGFLTATHGGRMDDLPGDTVVIADLPFWPHSAGPVYTSVLGFDGAEGSFVCGNSEMSGSREARMVGYNQTYYHFPAMTA